MALHKKNITNSDKTTTKCYTKDIILYEKYTVKTQTVHINETCVFNAYA